MQSYDWPGNVRELQNVIERATILAEGGQIDIDDLPAGARSGRQAVYVKRLANDIANAHARIERGIGILKDRLYVAPV